MTSDSFFNRHGRRIMICVRGNCAPSSLGRRLEVRLAELIYEYGLDDPDHDYYARCTITNCLAVCENGPVMIVHPEGIRYHRVDEAALERIFHEHIVNDRPVTELMVRDQPTISIFGQNKRRRSGKNRRG